MKAMNGSETDVYDEMRGWGRRQQAAEPVAAVVAVNRAGALNPRRPR